jgi:GT2 family glycosyltransferase
MNLDNLEFQNRVKRAHKNMQPGQVDRLDMGGLYRRAALEQVGYFTNRNLHAYEEFDLSARLHTAGWLLRRLDTPAVRHYGHTVSSYRLLVRRWKTRYAWGGGELLRAALGRPHFAFVLSQSRALRLYVMVWGWWLALLASLFAQDVFGAHATAFSLALLLSPWLFMTFRKRSLRSGLFSIVTMNILAAGMLCGLLSPPRADPLAPLNYRVIR